MSISTRALLVVALLVAPAAVAAADDSYDGSRFDEVWTQVASDPYAALPHYTVRWSSFFSGWFHNDLLDDSRRTLDSAADLKPAKGVYLR
jgi:hypothetical protein